MSTLHFILGLIGITSATFIVRFIIDLMRHKEDLRKEKGNNLLLAGFSTVIFFFSSFGVCDFAVSTIFYRIKKLVSDKKLPGTLNTQCVLPVAVMALGFISTIQVDLLTLIVCIVSQVFGAYLGPRFVVKLPTGIIRKIIGIGLFIAAFFIIAGKLNWMPAGGMAIELTGTKLFIAAISLFFFGALNNVGIGSYPLTMATLYALGMSPLVSFPIMMGACAFSTSIGSLQIIKYGEYSRKITLFTSIFGVIGVFFAIFCIKGLNVSLLQWVIVAILFYTSINLLLKEFKSGWLRFNSPAQ
ncbi:MAG: hypothetical protein A3F10_04400 [Coxiella sp. RIFCSPHIGHO2_12_FULL_42_15]|nr:MAG: hypothetical protein A3F10_04400 [Coxiella sp. RIFCSPHIGHO2_12_FULL_42_15]